MNSLSFVSIISFLLKKKKLLQTKQSIKAKESNNGVPSMAQWVKNLTAGVPVVAQ